MTPFEIVLDRNRRVSARFYQTGDASAGVTFILAHGAGAPQTHPFMTGFARGLAARGFDVVTFNFPYMEEKRRVPDSGPVLEACYAAVVRATRERHELSRTRLVIGGKSMGGRIASQVVAHDADTAAAVDALVFLGYPLHPPGKPTQLRSRHLPEVRKPMLFVQGSRDAFGTPEELRPILSRLEPAADIFVVDDGDHSLNVPRAKNTAQAEMFGRIQDSVVTWVQTLL